MLFPKWITDMEPGSKVRRQAEVKFAVNLAAIYASESGHVKDLAEKISFTVQGFALAIKKGDCSPGLAFNLEAVAGRDVIQRELICSKLRK